MNKNPIYCAVDTSDLKNAKSIIEKVAPYIGGIKLGLEFFTSCGLSGIEQIKKYDIPLFIDLKLYDIPATVEKSLKNIMNFEPLYTTLHLSGGAEMLENCVRIKNELNSKTNLIGVTMLTSFDNQGLQKIGIDRVIKEEVKILSELAFECGMDGIVCSPKEIENIKSSFRGNLKIITPGIRGQSDKSNDQKRTLSAKDAIEKGADVIVVGRPITHSEDPSTAAQNLYKELM